MIFTRKQAAQTHASKQQIHYPRPLKTIDPRIILFWCASLIMIVSLTPFRPLIKWLILSLIISANFGLTKFSWRIICRRFFLLLPLLIFLSLSIIFFSAQPFSMFSRKVALEILVRSIMVWGILVSCSGLLNFKESIQALDRLRCPTYLIMMIGITFRFLPLIREDLRHQQQALKSRTFGHIPWSHKLRLASSLISHNFFRVFEKAQKIHWSLISRNFSGKWISTQKHHLTWWEWGIIGLILIFNGVFLWWS